MEASMEAMRFGLSVRPPPPHTHTHRTPRHATPRTRLPRLPPARAPHAAPARASLTTRWHHHCHPCCCMNPPPPPPACPRRAQAAEQRGIRAVALNATNIVVTEIVSACRARRTTTDSARRRLAWRPEVHCPPPPHSSGEAAGLWWPQSSVGRSVSGARSLPLSLSSPPASLWRRPPARPPARSATPAHTQASPLTPVSARRWLRRAARCGRGASTAAPVTTCWT